MNTIEVKVPDIGDFTDVAVIEVLVKAGDKVVEGQPLLSIEAMKMEMWLHARASGTVSALHAQIKDSVAAGSVLAEIDITEEVPA